MLAFLDGVKPAFRLYTAANLCWSGYRAGILVDETVIPEIRAILALLPARDMPLRTRLRISGFPSPAIGLPRASPERRRFVASPNFLRGAQWPSSCLPCK
jgi:hypothetical protein